MVDIKTILRMIMRIALSLYLINLTFVSLQNMRIPSTYIQQVCIKMKKYISYNVFKIGSVNSIEIRFDQVIIMKCWYVNIFCI